MGVSLGSGFSNSNDKKKNMKKKIAGLIQKSNTT